MKQRDKQNVRQDKARNLAGTNDLHKGAHESQTGPRWQKATRKSQPPDPRVIADEINIVEINKPLDYRTYSYLYAH